MRIRPESYTAASFSHSGDGVNGPVFTITRKARRSGGNRPVTIAAILFFVNQPAATAHTGNMAMSKKKAGADQELHGFHEKSLQYRVSVSVRGYLSCFMQGTHMVSDASGRPEKG